MSMQNTPTQKTHPKKYLQSFGRRHGHKLHASRSRLMQTLLPQLLVSLPEGDINPASLFDGRQAPLWFEIGFGGGEHLAEQARRNRNVNFIGCEPYINGVASLLALVEEHSLTNIRLFDGDARLLMEKLPDNSIERLFVLFPDPWPKARHHKRRIISTTSLELFYSKISPGGILRIATDHVDYGTWILEQTIASNRFIWEANTQADWQDAPADWVKTRYQAKAEDEGRLPLFLDFRR